MKSGLGSKYGVADRGRAMALRHRGTLKPVNPAAFAFSARGFR
jgi:hypothetical protein